MSSSLLRAKPTRLYLCMQAIVLAAISSPAFASDNNTTNTATTPASDSAEKPDVNTLPVISLKASKKNSSYTAKKASTSTKLDLSIKETPQSVTVVTRKQIDDMGATNLGELLAQTTGVVLVGDNTERTAFSIRGFGTGDSWGTSTLQQDGVATTSQNVSVSKPDMAMYESVEVMRGAAGLMQGSGEPSGAINLIRKKPTANFQANGAISYGSWNSMRGEFDISSKLNTEGTVRGRFVAAYQDADSFMTAVTRDSSLLYGIVSADLTESTLLNLGITHQEEHAVPVNSLPRYKDGSDIGLSRKHCGCSAWNFWDKENTNVFVDITHQFDNGWSAKSTFSKSWVNMDMTFSNLSGALDKNTKQPDTTTGPFMYDYAYRYKQKVEVWDVFAKGPYQLFGREHELVVGANAQDSSTPGQWTDYYKIGLVDVFNTNPYQQPAIAPRYDKDGGKSFIDQKQYGAYLTTRLSIADPLKAILGLRISSYEYLYGYENNDVSKPTYGQRQIRTKYKANNIRTPYVGLTYKINDTYSTYASYTDTFVAQSVKDVSGKLLDPIQGQVFETGIKGSFNNDAVIATLAVFRIDQINRSVDDLNSEGKCTENGGKGYCKIASGKAISEGIEAELRGEVLPNLNLSLGYTYNTTEYAKDLVNQGRVFNENTPEHLARLFATYKLPNQLTIGGGVNYQSEWEVGRYSLTPAKQPAYALVNLMASYPVNDHLTVAFNANNVFDKKYYSYITNTANRYGDPANFKLSLRAKF